MITAVTVERTASERKGGKISGLDITINVGVDKVEDETVKMKYDFIVSYGKEAGYIVVSGFAIAKETKKMVGEIDKAWKDKKELPDTYRKEVANVISVYGTSNAAIMARVINFPPPIVPPPMKEKEKDKENKK